MNQMTIIIMGVTGAGKSTIGKLLAEQISAPFIDGDDLHPPEKNTSCRKNLLIANLKL